jgi:hypothetical protein
MYLVMVPSCPAARFRAQETLHPRNFVVERLSEIPFLGLAGAGFKPPGGEQLFDRAGAAARTRRDIGKPGIGATASDGMPLLALNRRFL